MNENMDEQELDFLSLLKFLVSNWRLVFVCLVLGGLVGFGYFHFADKEYKAQGSFLVRSDDKAGGAGSLLGYAKNLGVEVPSNFDSYVMAVLESRRIKRDVAIRVHSRFKNAQTFVIKEVPLAGSVTENETYQWIKALKLKGNLVISKTKDNVYSVVYYNKDPNIAYAVVDEYISTLISLNESLELSVKKDVIIVLDPPESPIIEGVARPRLAVSILFGMIFGFIVAGSYVLIRYKPEAPRIKDIV